MRRFVNGDEYDLDPESATVTPSSDRLFVKTAEGVHTAVAVTQGDAVLVSYRGRQFRIERKSARSSAHHHVAEGEMRATMPGQIIDVLVAERDSVQKGKTILVLEAMKTHQPFTAPFDGTVSKVEVSKGDQVSEGQLLVIVEEP